MEGSTGTVLTELPRWVCGAAPSPLMAQPPVQAGANIPAGAASISWSFIPPSLRCFFLRRISLQHLSTLWDLELDPQMLFSHDYPLVLNLFFDVPLAKPNQAATWLPPASLPAPSVLAGPIFQPCSHSRPPSWLTQTSRRAQPALLVSCEPWRAHLNHSLITHQSCSCSVVPS